MASEDRMQDDLEFTQDLDSYELGAFKPAGQAYADRRYGAHAAYGSARNQAGEERVRAGAHAKKPAEDGVFDEKTNRKGAKIAVRVIAVVAALFVAIAVALALWVGNLGSSMGFEDKGEENRLRESLSGVEHTKSSAFYMLILGSDSQSGWENGSRSDVIMLTRIDPDAAQADLISIPRDTMIDLGEHGTQKINAAYSFGGAAGAVDTISEFAGVPITHYAEVHFDELEEAVDMLGGVTVNIPEAFEAAGMYFPAGEQTLNGEQALVYARERHGVTGGDFSRAQAQREIVTAIIEKVLQTEAADLPDTIVELASCVTTDYSVTDLASLAQKFIGKELTVYSAVCPSYAYNEDGVSYACPMFHEWQAMMRRVDAGLDPNDTEAKIPEPQASDSTLGGAYNSPAPRDYEELAAEAGLTTDDVIQAG